MSNNPSENETGVLGKINVGVSIKVMFTFSNVGIL